MLEVNCLNCNALMFVYAKRVERGDSKYCSKQCYCDKLKKGRIKECPVCKKEFDAGSNRKTTKYCSKECFKLRAVPKVVNCTYCNKELIRKNCELTPANNYFCNQDCHRTWKKITGSNKGWRKPLEYRLTEQAAIDRARDDVKQWRKDVFKRDNWKCVICEAKGDIQAHHLNSFKRFPELRTELSNGVTLCTHHHQKFHGKYGNRNFTVEDFYEFLNKTKEIIIC